MPAISATGELGRCRRWHGFTLLEVVVVLAIMTLLTASIPLAIDRLIPSRRVAVAADRISSDIRWAQSEAARLGTAFELTLTRSGYELRTQGSTRRAFHAVAQTSIRLDAPFVVPGQDLIIYPDGTTTGARLDITDSGRHASIEVGVLTGRIRPLAR